MLFFYGPLRHRHPDYLLDLLPRRLERHLYRVVYQTPLNAIRTQPPRQVESRVKRPQAAHPPSRVADSGHFDITEYDPQLLCLSLAPVVAILTVTALYSLKILLSRGAQEEMVLIQLAKDFPAVSIHKPLQG
jgi:hypothetical protein